MDVREQARVLRNRWLIVAAVVVVGLAALALFGRGPRPEYRATATLVFDETGNPPRDAFVQDLTAAAALTRTPPVAAKAAARLNAVNTPADLASKITARADVNANTVEITTVPYTSASRARALANGFAAALTDSLGDQQDALATRASNASATDQTTIADQLKTVEGKLAAAAKAPIDQQEMLRAQRDAILRHLQDTVVANLALPPQQALTQVGGASVHQVDHSRLAPTTIPGWMLAAFVLAVLGCASALVVDRVDGRLRTRAAVERAFGLPVLAAVPPVDGEGVITAAQPLSSAADAFRDLRAALARLGRPAVRHGAGRSTSLDLTSALVTSADGDEGKTSTAVNLAAAIAETGRSVLVVDCDMRAPDAHGVLGVDPGPGLSDVLLGAATLDQVAVPTSVPGVRLVGAGRPTQNPAALLARQQDFVSLARMLADFVVLDGPPLSVHDASELVWMVEAVVVVCSIGQTTAEAARRAQERLELLGAPAGGVVLLSAFPVPEGGRPARRAPALPRIPEATPPPMPPPQPRAPQPEPQAPPRPQPAPAPTGGGGSFGLSSSSSSSVGVLTRPAAPSTSPQTRPEPATIDWATRAEPEPSEADSDTIRRQLALPARRVASWAGTGALMVGMWLLIRSFLFLSFYIPSPSMTPVLKPGDRVLVSKLSYRLHDVNRGDIVVFKRPPHVQAGPEVKDLVKRVVGLPGDTVEAHDGQVFVNGRALNEPYIAKGATTTPISPQHIAANHYWVMGDNRTVSEDSRYFGSISGNLIVGRVFFQVWPVSSIGFV